MKSAAIWCISILLGFSYDSCAKLLITVALFNRMGGTCPKVEIELNGRTNELSGSVPNGNSSDTSDYWPYPMPATVTLNWTTETQSNHSATLALPKPSAKHAEFLDYDFVILPNGRADVIVLASSGDATDAEVEREIKLENKLCCDGGSNYRVAIKDTTGLNVDGLDARFGPYVINAGTHLSGTGQNYSIATGLPYPVTKSVSLHWMTSDGHLWDKVVDLANILPSNLDDKCFWFVLKEQGNVGVQIVDWNDLRAGKHPDLCHGF